MSQLKALTNLRWKDFDFIKSFIVSLLLLIVNLVITPVDSVLEVLPPLGFKSSIKLYSLPLLTMTKETLLLTTDYSLDMTFRPDFHHMPQRNNFQIMH